MNKVKHTIILLLLVVNYGCSQQKEKSNFKNTIELSIKSVSSKVNPLIKKMNVLLKEGKSDNELIDMYNDSKSTILLNKELIN